MYLTGDYKTAFNYGKQKETEDRVKHIKTLWYLYGESLYKPVTHLKNEL